MAEPVSIEQLKTHLRVGLADAGEDEQLAALITAARRSIENRINRVVVGLVPSVTDDDLAVVHQAVLLLAGHWYANREAVVTGTISTEIPLAVEWLTAPLRRWT